MSNLKEAFGLRLREIRKKKKLTQEKLSELLNLSPRQLIRIENGKNFPSAETLSKLGSALDVELNSFFDFVLGEDGSCLTNKLCFNPCLKIIQKGKNEVLIEHIVVTKGKRILPKMLKTNEVEQFILNLSKQNREALTVECYEDDKKVSIKTFHPDGSVEEHVSRADLTNQENYCYIQNKLRQISSNPNKVDFVKLAIDALEDKDALQHLKILIQGMDLMF